MGLKLEGVEPAGPVDQREHLPGDFSIWVFVLGDMLFFAAYLVIFLIYRAHERTTFLASQHHVDLTAGAVNTLVLLASSQFVARAVRASRDGDPLRAERLILAGAGLGLIFVLIKAGEWAGAAGRGFTLQRNDFWMFYYLLTAVHLVHVLLGLAVLALLVWEIRRGKQSRAWVVEAGATFWHMVDLLWICIFAVVYLAR